MSNYIIDSIYNEISNVAVLSLTAQDLGFYETIDRTAETAERFMQSAALLLPEQFLALQITTGKGEKKQVRTFSSAGVGITKQDFGWLFQSVADIASFSVNAPARQPGSRNKIYKLCPKPQNTTAQPGNRNDEKEEAASLKYLSQLFDEMAQTASSMQIQAGVAADNTPTGMLTLSLPDKLSLKMRTLLSLAFPKNQVERLDSSAADNELPLAFLQRIMSDVLITLLNDSHRQKPTSNYYDYDDDAFEYVDEHDDEEPLEYTEPEPACQPQNDDTLIDELDLSVRSYNCLKRAGINTVGELRRLQDKDYRNIRNLGRKSIEEIEYKLAEISRQTAPAQLTARSYLDMLDELIGLQEVKEQVRKITAFVKMKQDMAKLGKDNVPMVLNMEFVGNPGTAKTTVARILAGILNEIGLLKSNEIVEVGRADLVAQYVGQTADRVKSVFKRAKGKLLFIDEAYSLLENSEGDFGDEAINTIVQEMENNRNDTVVIFAGYPDKMRAFLARNPGLRSRIPFHINFADYSAQEMTSIMLLEADKRGFAFDNSAVFDRALSLCERAVGNPEMGNGRFCRNLVENAILNYALRNYGAEAEAEPNHKFSLVAADFVLPENVREEKAAAPIGFRA